MGQHLMLSLPEVQFLLAQAGDEVPAREVLGFSGLEPRWTSAGLSSLVARGLATPAREGLMLSPDLRGAAAALLRPRVWVGIVRTSDEGQAAMLFGAPDEGRSSVITLAGLGCLEFSVLSERMGSPEHALGTLMPLILAAPGTVTELRVPISGEVAALSLRHTADDTWEMENGDGPSSASREQISAAASDLVSRALVAA